MEHGRKGRGKVSYTIRGTNTERRGIRRKGSERGGREGEAIQSRGHTADGSGLVKTAAVGEEGRSGRLMTGRTAGLGTLGTPVALERWSQYPHWAHEF